MSSLSPQNEQFVEQALARGLFASREELVDAAVEELRIKRDFEQLALSPEQLQGVDHAIDQSEAGQGCEYGEADWQDLLRRSTGRGRPG
ncbi:MAG: hypothetical protein C0483_00570 [Pirellula sp.]|nr:hypothetical protein [Pirellula sp.]